MDIWKKFAERARRYLGTVNENDSPIEVAKNMIILINAAESKITHAKTEPTTEKRTNFSTPQFTEEDIKNAKAFFGEDFGNPFNIFGDSTLNEK